MDQTLLPIFYNTIREFHNRYRSQDREMHKEEMLFYLAHLRAGIKHAKWMELVMDGLITGAENAAKST